MDAATKLFARQGFHGTSVAQLAAASGVQAGALYYHIKSKDELLWQILHAYVSDMRERTRQAYRSHDDPEQRLRVMVRDHVVHIIRYRRQVTIELRDLPALPPARREDLQEIRDGVQRYWQQALDDGVRAGAFRTSDRVITNSVLSMLSVISQWFRMRGRYSSEQIAEIVADFVLSGLLAWPVPRPDLPRVAENDA